MESPLRDDGAPDEGASSSATAERCDGDRGRDGGDGGTPVPSDRRPPPPPYEVELLTTRLGGRITASCDVSGASFAPSASGRSVGPSGGEAARTIGEAAVLLARTGGVVEFWTTFGGGGGGGGASEGMASGSGYGSDEMDCDCDGGECGDDENDGSESVRSGDEGDALELMRRPCSIRIDDRVEGLCPLPHRPPRSDVRRSGRPEGSGDPTFTTHSMALHVVAITQGGTVVLLVLRCECGSGGADWSLVIAESVTSASWERRRGRNAASTEGAGEKGIDWAATSQPLENMPSDDISPWKFVCPPESFPLFDWSNQEEDENHPFHRRTSGERSPVEIQYDAALVAISTGNCLLMQLETEVLCVQGSSPSLVIDMVPSFPLPAGFEMWPSHRVRYIRPLPGTFDGLGRPMVCALLSPAAAADGDAGTESYPGIANSGIDGLLVCCAMESRFRLSSVDAGDSVSTKKRGREEELDDREAYGRARPRPDTQSPCCSHSDDATSEARFWFVPGPWSLQSAPLNMSVYPSYRKGYWDQALDPEVARLQSSKAHIRKPCEEGVICITATNIQFCSHRGGILATSAYFSHRAWTASSYHEDDSPGSKNTPAQVMSNEDSEVQLLGACALSNRNEQSSIDVGASFLVCLRRTVVEESAPECKLHLFVASLVWRPSSDLLGQSEKGIIPSFSVEAIRFPIEGDCSSNDTDTRHLDSILATVENGCMVASLCDVVILGEYICELSLTSTSTSIRQARRFFDGPIAALPICSAVCIPSSARSHGRGEVENAASNGEGTTPQASLWDAESCVALSGGTNITGTLSVVGPGLLGPACAVRHELCTDVGLGSSPFFRAPLACLSPLNVGPQPLLGEEGHGHGRAEEECLLLFTSAEATLVMSCLASSPEMGHSPQITLDGLSQQLPLRKVMQLEPVKDPLRHVGIDPTARTLAVCSVPVSTIRARNGSQHEGFNRLVVQVTTCKVQCRGFKGVGERTAGAAYMGDLGGCTRDAAHSCLVSEYSLPDGVRIEHAALHSRDRPPSSATSTDKSRESDFSSGPLAVCALSCSDMSLRLIELAVAREDGSDPRGRSGYVFRASLPSQVSTRSSHGEGAATGPDSCADGALLAFESYVPALSLYCVDCSERVPDKTQRCREKSSECPPLKTKFLASKTIDDADPSASEYSIVVAVAVLDSPSVHMYGIRRRQPAFDHNGPVYVDVGMLEAVSLGARASARPTRQPVDAEISSLEFLPESSCATRSGCVALRLAVGFSDGTIATTSPVPNRPAGSRIFDAGRKDGPEGDAPTISWRHVGRSPPVFQRVPLSQSRAVSAGDAEDDDTKDDEKGRPRCFDEALRDAAHSSSSSYALVASCADDRKCTPNATLIVTVDAERANLGHRGDEVGRGGEGRPPTSGPARVAFFPLSFQQSAGSMQEMCAAAERSSNVTVLPFTILREPACCWMTNSGEYLNLGCLGMLRSGCHNRTTSSPFCGPVGTGDPMAAERSAVLHFCILETSPRKAADSAIGANGRSWFGVGAIETDNGTRIALFDISSQQGSGEGPLWMSQTMSPNKKVTAIAPCSPPPQVWAQHDRDGQAPCETSFVDIASNILECVSARQEPCVSVAIVEHKFDDGGEILVDEISTTLYVFQIVSDVRSEGITFWMEGIGSFTVDGACFCLDGALDGPFEPPVGSPFTFGAGIDEKVAIFEWDGRRLGGREPSTRGPVPRILGTASPDESPTGRPRNLTLASSAKAPYSTAISAISCVHYSGGGGGAGARCDVYVAAAQLLHSVAVFRYRPETGEGMRLLAMDLASARLSSCVLLSFDSGPWADSGGHHPGLVVMLADQAHDVIMAFTIKGEGCSKKEGDAQAHHFSDDVKEMETAAKQIKLFGNGERINRILRHPASPMAFIGIGSEGSIASAYLRRTSRDERGNG